MRLSRLAVALVPFAAAAAIAASPSVRKDPHGVYGMIDSVVFEPATGSPDRARLWGAFALADPIDIKDGKVERVEPGAFRQPARGYMYYTVNPHDQTGTRTQWFAIRAAAGTGRLVAWGAHFPPYDPARPPGPSDTVYMRLTETYNGRVRAPGEPLAQPDTFPRRMQGVSAESLGRRRSAAQLGFTRPDSTPRDR